MKKSLLYVAIALLIVLLTGIIVGCGEKKRYKAMAQEDFDKLPDGMYAVMETDKGNIVLQLYYDKTPITVASFVALAEGKAGQSQKKGPFYDGLTFHRVVDGFVVQGGDPQGNGTGGPGYNFPDEIVKDLVFDGPGILAMANAGPGTNGSQFFITLAATPHLNGKHTIFGRVMSDQAVVRNIKQGDKIKKVSIVSKGADADNFRPEMQEQIDKMVHSKINETVPNAQKSPEGIYYTIQKEGSSEKPKSGQEVTVHYKGWLLDSGLVFDSSYNRGKPIAFQAGVGQVIPGWDDMILDMKVGEKRLVVIPPDLAYGAGGAGGVIPPNAWLVFEMERIS